MTGSVSGTPVTTGMAPASYDAAAGAVDPNAVAVAQGQDPSAPAGGLADPAQALPAGSLTQAAANPQAAAGAADVLGSVAIPLGAASVLGGTAAYVKGSNKFIAALKAPEVAEAAASKGGGFWQNLVKELGSVGKKWKVAGAIAALGGAGLLAYGAMTKLKSAEQKGIATGQQDAAAALQIYQQGAFEAQRKQLEAEAQLQQYTQGGGAAAAQPGAVDPATGQAIDPATGQPSTQLSPEAAALMDPMASQVQLPTLPGGGPVAGGGPLPVAGAPAAAPQAAGLPGSGQQTAGLPGSGQQAAPAAPTSGQAPAAGQMQNFVQSPAAGQTQGAQGVGQLQLQGASISFQSDIEPGAKFTVVQDHGTFATLDQANAAVRSLIDVNAQGSSYLRFAVVQDAAGFHAVVAQKGVGATGPAVPAQSVVAWNAIDLGFGSGWRAISWTPQQGMTQFNFPYDTQPFPGGVPYGQQGGAAPQGAPGQQQGMPGTQQGTPAPQAVPGQQGVVPTSGAAFDPNSVLGRTFAMNNVSVNGQFLAGGAIQIKQAAAAGGFASPQEAAQFATQASRSLTDQWQRLVTLQGADGKFHVYVASVVNRQTAPIETAGPMHVFGNGWASYFDGATQQWVGVPAR